MSTSDSADRITDITNRVNTVLMAFGGLDADAIPPDAHLVNDLGLDSLQLIEVVMALEDEFSLDIPDDDVPGVATVEGVAAYIAKRTAGAVSAAGVVDVGAE